MVYHKKSFIMKNIILFIAICFGCSMQLQASHLMGGQLTAQHIGVDSVKVTLTLYRDTTGIQLDTMFNKINVFDTSSCGITSIGLANFNIPFKAVTSIGNGVEEYIFETILCLANTAIPFYFLDSSNFNYLLSYDNCCRNAAIINLAAPGSESFHLETRYTQNSTINSTPIFLNQPVTTAEVNIPFQYNPLPFDADADSLHWYLDTAWSSCNTPCAGYIAPAFTNLDPFAIDPSTGQITWTPATLGNFVTTVMVDEYRAGTKIGFIRRDMQIIVLDSTAFATGSTPKLSMNGVVIPNQQQINFTINANQTFNLAASVADLDSNDLKITLNGEPFIVANAANSFITNGTALATATMTWTPTNAEVRESDYLSTLRVFEKNINSIFVKVSDVTVAIKVVKTNIPEAITYRAANENAIIASPNPANNLVAITVSTNQNSNANLVVSDVLGNQMIKQNYTLKSGANGIVLNTSSFANGIYFVTINGYKTKLQIQH
jgi:Secretion system C-terminal sorting domain